MNNLINLLSEKEKHDVIYAKFKKGQIIFLEDDNCDSIGIVINGQIDIISYSFSGKEINYNSLQNGDIFGNNLLFSDSPKYKGNVISKSDSSVAFIKKDALIKILQNNQNFLIEYLKIQSNFGKTLNARIKLLSFDNAFERFNYYMFIHQQKIHYQSVTSLANALFLERETLSRLLSKLEKDGVIYRDKHTIKLL